jgi:hypothetical protein
MRTDPVLLYIKFLRVLIASILVVSHEANLPTSIFPLLTIVNRTCQPALNTVGWKVKGRLSTSLVYYTVGVGWYLVIKARILV